MVRLTRLATPAADNARRLRAYRDVGPCGLPSRSALGAILPFHDVRYHASALSQAKLCQWRSDGSGKFFSANEQVPAGGARRDRTDDLLLAKQALSQLSYGPGSASVSIAHLARSGTPDANKMVGLGRLELPTSRLSSARSNQLSYKPELFRPTDRWPHAHDCWRSREHTAIAARGSFAKKEKRRRRRPADGPSHPETTGPDVSKRSDRERVRRL